MKCVVRAAWVHHRDRRVLSVFLLEQLCVRAESAARRARDR